MDQLPSLELVDTDDPVEVNPEAKLAFRVLEFFDDITADWEGSYEYAKRTKRDLSSAEQRLYDQAIGYLIEYFETARLCLKEEL